MPPGPAAHKLFVGIWSTVSCGNTQRPRDLDGVLSKPWFQNQVREGLNTQAGKVVGGKLLK